MIELTEEFLLDKCGPYIRTLQKVYEKTGRKAPLLRGSVGMPLEQPLKFQPRKQSMNTNPVIHEAANEWFKETFGIAARTDTVFTTTRLEVASDYGSPAYFVPIGKFSFYYSEKIDDMYHYINNRLLVKLITDDKAITNDMRASLLKLVDEHGHKFITEFSKVNPLLLARYTREILEQANYKKNNIGAFVLKNEIMVHCSEFILLPVSPVTDRYKEFFEDIVFI